MVYVTLKFIPYFTVSICNELTTNIFYIELNLNSLLIVTCDRLCGLVVRIPGYRSRGPGSIPGATKFF
jgi:hypothetical protein